MSTNSALAFPDFLYQRPDLEKEEKAFREVLADLTSATSIEAAVAAVERIDAIRAGISTAQNILKMTLRLFGKVGGRQQRMFLTE